MIRKAYERYSEDVKVLDHADWIIGLVFALVVVVLLLATLDPIISSLWVSFIVVEGVGLGTLALVSWLLALHKRRLRLQAVIRSWGDDHDRW